LKKLMACIILAAFMLSSATAFANSGPTFWQGYPSSDMLLIEQDSPIAVKNENLIFDFSDYDNSDYAISGKVSATYEMVNPTNEQRLVQMAFPFVARLGELSLGDITITADDNAVSYDIYVGDVVDSYVASADRQVRFDFEDIISTITNKLYEAQNFTVNEKGKLYIIEVKPTTDQRINFAVDFNFDLNKTHVFTKGFNRYERDDGKTRIAAWCYEPKVLEIYVLGEDIDLNINAYTDGELREKTDLFTYQISDEEVELRPYLMDKIKSNKVRKENNMISDAQLYNLYAKSLDTYFTQNMGYCTVNDLIAQEYYERILTLVYTVGFPRNSQKEVNVSYKTSGTMDRRDTSEPLYSFDYILNPAKNWKDFKNLHIEIIPPQKAPYIVKSSIQFLKGENNAYTATLAELPENDLSFTLYAHEKITLLDKTLGKLTRKFGYFILPVINAATLLVIGTIFVMVFLKRKNKYI
jgi:hypothetical protein